MPEDVRPLAIDDTKAAAALYVAVFNVEPWNERWTEDSAGRRLAEMMATPGYIGLGFWSEGALVGLVVGHTEQHWAGQHYVIQETCVRPDLQGRGLGTGLLALLIEELVRRDVEQIWLITLREGPTAEFWSRREFRPSSRSHMLIRRLARSTG